MSEHAEDKHGNTHALGGCDPYRRYGDDETLCMIMFSWDWNGMEHRRRTVMTPTTSQVTCLACIYLETL